MVLIVNCINDVKEFHHHLHFDSTRECEECHCLGLHLLGFMLDGSGTRVKFITFGSCCSFTSSFLVDFFDSLS